MSGRLGSALVLLAALAAVAAARPSVAFGPQAGGLERIDLRVSAAPPGGPVTVDRGSRDGVEEGDRVFFRPRGGGVVPGVVVLVEERVASVDLHDPDAVLEPGTGGEVVVPRERLEALEAERSERGRQTPHVVPEHPPWTNTDDEHTPEMPLLVEIAGVRPEERGRQFSGRAYFTFDGVAASPDDRTDVFSRLGTDLRVGNPFGRGGELHLDAELNGRRTFVDDQVDLTDGRNRIDRASWLRGGTRYDLERWEFGRFLLHGMPEFGVIDGFEYSRRLGSGDTVGGSVGFMPTPDREMESGNDFQLSAYYLWRADEREQLTIATGLQKTFHQARADRDLWVTRVRYLPVDGWSFYGTTWVDFYDTRDAVKRNGPELTQAFVSTSRQWEGGHGVDVTFSHLRFPELQRVEFAPPADLLNARNDRLAVTGWRRLSPTTRVRGLVGVWDDEDDQGGDAEGSLELDGWLGERSRSSVTLLGTQGDFATVVGARLAHGRALETGRWDLLYEATNQDQHGFQADNDDILSHWLRFSRDFHTPSGWDLSLHADARAWDDEGSFGLGVYLQRRF